MTSELRAGDVLHIPRGWYRDLLADGPGIWVSVLHGDLLPVPPGWTPPVHLL